MRTVASPARTAASRFSWGVLTASSENVEWTWWSPSRPGPRTGPWLIAASSRRQDLVDGQEDVLEVAHVRDLGEVHRGRHVPGEHGVERDRGHVHAGRDGQRHGAREPRV